MKKLIFLLSIILGIFCLSASMDKSLLKQMAQFSFQHAGFVALFFAGLVVFGVVARLLMNKIVSLSCGWKKVVLTFPARQTLNTGEIYKGIMGDIGTTQVRQGFVVQLGLEGLTVIANFAPSAPIFIPWSSVEPIRDSGYSLSLRIAEGMSMRLELPRQALSTIRTNSPNTIIRRS